MVLIVQEMSTSLELRGYHLESAQDKERQRHGAPVEVRRQNFQELPVAPRTAMGTGSDPHGSFMFLQALCRKILPGFNFSLTELPWFRFFSL